LDKYKQNELNKEVKKILILNLRICMWILLLNQKENYLYAGFFKYLLKVIRLNPFKTYLYANQKIEIMKKIAFTLILFMLGLGSMLSAQDLTNFISCKVNDSMEYKAEARRMKIPVRGFEYLALAAFKVSPDIQVWIRMYYFSDSIKPGKYPILSEDDLESESKNKANHDLVWVLVDYTQETKGLGHAFHDGESLSGTLTISKVNKTYIEGSFDATLKGVYYKKRVMATMTGSGIKGNLERKAFTKGGGGMLANAGAHDHDNTRKSDETDTIVLSAGKFQVDWSKPEKEEEKK
jgi:hypothetical protein